MKLKSLLLAAMLASSFGSAYAGIINGNPMPDIVLQQNLADPQRYSGHFGNDTSGDFSDVFTFTPWALPGSKASGTVVSFELDGGGLISFGGASLNGVGFVQTAADRWSLASTFIPPGPLTLTVWGDAGTGGSYSGTLNLLSPVPEAETYAMMLGGLALVGAIARRRKQS